MGSVGRDCNRTASHLISTGSAVSYVAHGLGSVRVSDAHRNRLGEKCMQYMRHLCVVTLRVRRAGERIGFQRVLDLFEEIRCIRSPKHFWPKTPSFLQSGYNHTEVCTDGTLTVLSFLMAAQTIKTEL